MRTKRRLGQLSWMGLCALVVWMAGIAPAQAPASVPGRSRTPALSAKRALKRRESHR